ncbi:hypothetical protein C8J57DRAFT_1144620 [Mycena rebaudengoi]|nr:hypothetical protein C8J57DRAFT_1144620 [Mycena rebaudengoi]
MSVEQVSDPHVLPTSPGLPREPSRIEELWFKDGTLVLAAENSLFRVYAGLLAKRSPVFHDMLQIPQPEDTEIIDGCPVVRLADDERDLRYFLSALFDYEFFGAFPATTTFDIVAGVIRLSTKYDVATLRNRALTHLSSAFPFARVEFPGSPSWEIPDHEWIRVVLFAREMSIEWILPIAFYQVAEKCTPAQLLHGIIVDGVSFKLTPQDTLALIEYSLTIGRAAYAEVAQFLVSYGTCYQGKDKEHCLRSRLEACETVKRRRADNIFPLNLWTTEDLESLGVCYGCKSVMRVAWQGGLDAFWAGLPHRFGLSGWEALRHMKEADLA